MFCLIGFVISWIVWAIFSDKKRWRELFVVSIFASYLGCLTDVLIEHYPLWQYQGGNPLLLHFFDEFGWYIVVPYLFIQWFPQKKSFPRVFGYFLIWTGITIAIEWIHLFTNHIVYKQWWNLGWSYTADWILFSLFYLFHKVFKLNRLTKK